MQNLLISVVSKGLSFLVSLYVARMLSETEYGLYVYVGVFLTILPIFQFGSMNGAAILLPKRIARKDGSEEDFFFTYNFVSHFIQFFSCFLLFFLKSSLDVNVLFMIALGYFLGKRVENAQMFLNAKLEFFKANMIKAVDLVLRPVLILYFFYSDPNIGALFTASCLASFLAWLISLYLLPPCHIGLSTTQGLWKTLKEIYGIGFLIYASWVLDMLFCSLDRWCIFFFYSLEELAAYGFTSSLTLNMWALSLTLLAPYSQLLYKHVAEGNIFEIKNLVEKTNRRIYVFSGTVTLIAIACYPFLLRWIVKKYFGTEFLFITLAVAMFFLSISPMYNYYMVSNNLHFVLLKYHLLILAVNFFLNALFILFHLDIIFFSYSTIVTLLLYFILVRRCFYADLYANIKVKVEG